MERKLLAKVCLLGVISYFGFAPVLSGAVLKVVNENKKDLHVKIVPEGAATENLRGPGYDIKRESYKPITITGHDIGNKSYFSIKGATNWVGYGDRCEHLSVEKDYRITFQDRTVGTACIAQEIKLEE